MVSAQEIAHYHEHGYIVVPDVLGGPTMESLRRELDTILEGARAVTAHTDVYDLEPGHRPDAPRVRRVKTPHKFFEGFKRLYRDPKLLAILQALLGPAVRLHGSKLNLKAPHYGSPVEWHQDWAFYPHTNDDILAVGVMLNDAISDNGPLMVVPGSHRGPIFDHHVDGYFCGAVDPDTVKDEIARAVPLTGRAGSMSFHHVRLLHGSAQNVSKLPRALLLYEYAAADAWPLMGVKDLEEFDARLVAGAPSIEPRVVSVPVRMPLPPALSQGSIYENQTAARRFFSLTEESEASPRT
jgi:phytanoyl-CoA hydroxylase